MRRALPWIVGAIALLLGLLVYALFLDRGRTPPIRDASGRIVPNSVASLEWVELGGVEQSVLIRGRDRENPVVLFLHGGPGMPVMYLAHSFQRELERDFTFVHWDRRGAGRSYRGCAGPFTVRRTLEDAYELTHLLRRRFGKRRVLLVGHSWGGYLGALAAHERPKLFLAYVGVAPATRDTARTRAIRRRAVAERARAKGDTAFARAVRAGERNVTEDDLFRYGGELLGEESFWPILWTGLRAPEYTLVDAMNVRRGVSCVGERMRYDVADGTLEEVTDFSVPVYFFVGEHDLNTPPDASREYFERITAPEKGFVVFERSAHFPFYEQPDRFGEELMRVYRASAERSSK